MFLMPSLYEPCGLSQMYSLRYGSVPIVRRTGGLADSVDMIDPESGTGTGILFNDYNEHGLTWALSFALELFAQKKLWRKVVQNGMRKNFSLQRQGEAYVEWFQRLAAP